MRRIKNGISTVVAASFVLFFAGLSFVYGANQIKGGITGPAEGVAGFTVSLVGKPSIHTTSTLNGDGNSEFYLTLPTNSIFSLKVEKTGYITSYSTPTILNSDIGFEGDRMQILLSSTSDWTNFLSSSGITIQSGKGCLYVEPLNNTDDPGRQLGGIMTAIVKNLSGASLVNTGNTLYINNDGSGNITLTSVSTSNTFAFVVFNLTPGTVITSAQMSGRTLNSRQTIIYPDSITSCASLYDGIIESTSGNFTGSVKDENELPLPSVAINLLGVKNTTSDGSGNYSLSNIPYNNIPKATTSTYLKATKTGYKDTYQLDFLEIGHHLGGETLISTSAFNQFASQAGVTIDASKGYIAGNVMLWHSDSPDEMVSGASVKIYNPDGTTNGARVYYLDSAMKIDPLLTSTSSQGVFVAFNINPATPILLTAQKGVLEFPYVLDRTFANGFTMTGIRQASSPTPANPASISGTISYAGTKTGTIGIGLFTTSDFSGAPAYGTMIAFPGSYSISNIAPGTYYIGASMDTNGDGIYDSTLDPAGVYASNPKVLSNNQNATGINITLTDAGFNPYDPNGVGGTTMADVLICYKQYLGIPTAYPPTDVDDGGVTMRDVLKIYKRYLGL